MENTVGRAEFEQYKETVEKENERQNGRLDKLEEVYNVIWRLTTSVEKMAVAIETQGKVQEAQAKVQEDQGKRLSAIERKPGDNWEKATWALAAAFITAVVGYICKSIGIF